MTRDTSSKIGASWRCLTKYRKDDLLFSTVIINAIPATLNPDYASLKTLVEQQVGDFRSQWSDAIRRRLPGLIWRGAVEFDLCRRDQIKDQRRDLFADLGVLDADRVLVPHIHAVLVRGVHSTDHINNELRRTFPGRRRVLNKTLFQHQSLEQALENLHGYTHKQRLQYADGGFDDVRTKFGDEYELPWLQTIGKLYRELDCVFRSKV
ncbi:MAG: hypothetical protein NVV74_15800 [Magnetospirillum sp.]|nr:hypothetical protein [Magnetospirillum sp.]